MAFKIQKLRIPLAWSYTNVKQLLRFNRLNQKLGFCTTSEDSSTVGFAMSGADNNQECTPVCEDIKNDVPVKDGNGCNSQEISHFLNDYCDIIKDGYTNYVTSCPRNRSYFEDGNLYVNKKTGYFRCHCGKTGKWEEFKDHTVKLLDLIQEKKILPENCVTKPVKSTTSKSVKFLNLWNSSQPIENASEEIISKLKTEIGIEVLKTKTLSKYGVRVSNDGTAMIVPLHSSSPIPKDSEYKCSGFHNISIISHVNKKGQTKSGLSHSIIPINSSISQRQLMFGLNHVKKGDRKVVFTGSEFDAMAVNQELDMLAVAQSREKCDIHIDLLTSLEQFDSIIIWLGKEDKKAERVTKNLNQERCYLIKPSTTCPTALKALQKKKSLDDIYRQAKLLRHKSISTIRDLRKEVLEEMLQSNKSAGIPWCRFTILNNFLKGHRKGELTVLTGPTGSGKTTFVSDYSLDLCMQGVSTLWGSFEIKNTRLLQTMLMQYSQCNIAANLDQFEYWADSFEDLPMYLMSFHGQQNPKIVLETMSHAVNVHDIEHVIVDNLQFMLGEEDIKEAFDRFLQQDKVISAFRKFATTNNCHVTLVVHPRKEKDNELHIGSIFGSGKASQEADNILILQDKRLSRKGGKKYIEIVKNRYDGDRGLMLLNFNKETRSYFCESNTESNSKNTNRLHQQGNRNDQSQPCYNWSSENFDAIEDESLIVGRHL